MWAWSEDHGRLHAAPLCHCCLTKYRPACRKCANTVVMALPKPGGPRSMITDGDIVYQIPSANSGDGAVPASKLLPLYSGRDGKQHCFCSVPRPWRTACPPKHSALLRHHVRSWQPLPWSASVFSLGWRIQSRDCIPAFFTRALDYASAGHAGDRRGRCRSSEYRRSAAATYGITKHPHQAFGHGLETAYYAHLSCFWPTSTVGMAVCTARCLCGYVCMTGVAHTSPIFLYELLVDGRHIDRESKCAEKIIQYSTCCIRQRAVVIWVEHSDKCGPSNRSSCKFLKVAFGSCLLTSKPLVGAFREDAVLGSITCEGTRLSLTELLNTLRVPHF